MGGADATAIIVIVIRHDLEVNTKGQSGGQFDTWYHGKSSKFGVRPKILCGPCLRGAFDSNTILTEPLTHVELRTVCIQSFSEHNR